MKRKILIVGAGAAGQELLPDLRIGFEVVGFLDDNKERHGEKVDGIKILGGTNLIEKTVKLEGIDEIIIAMPSAEGETIGEVVKLCVDAKVQFKIVPRVKEIIEGKARVETLRRVRVEDLLGRPVVKSDVVGLKKFFKGKKVLITGAAGSIGSELSRQISAYGPMEITFLDWWENGMFELQMELIKLFPRVKKNFVIANIQDKKRIREVFDEFKPDYVYHAAAYKHVPLMEDNPMEAIKNNIFGTFNVSQTAKRTGVERFVLVSTDKAANPKNVMGMTKFTVEVIGKILNGKTKFMAVRFGNVLGSYGSVVPIFEKQIKEGGPITITDRRMTRYFMTIPEAAQLILKAGAMGTGGELFILDMGKPVRIVDLANQIIRLSGLIPDGDIKIVFTGKRKGEKISEKLFSRKEELGVTKEGRIFKMKGWNVKNGDVSIFLSKLKKYISQNDTTLAKKELEKFVRRKI